MTPTTYGRDFAYCLKSHGGVRGFNASLWRFLLRCTLFCHSVATFLTSVSSYEGGCGFEVKQIEVMDAQKVDAFIMANGKFFPDYQVAAIRDMLLAADDSKWSMLQVMQFKDPTICLIISLFAGSLGIDRFFIGDTGLGIAKLITCGGFGIWTIVDWFLIMGAARDKNMQKLQMVL